MKILLIQEKILTIVCDLKMHEPVFRHSLFDSTEGSVVKVRHHEIPLEWIRLSNCESRDCQYARYSDITSSATLSLPPHLWVGGWVGSCQITKNGKNLDLIEIDSSVLRFMIYGDSPPHGRIYGLVVGWVGGQVGSCHVWWASIVQRFEFLAIDVSCRSDTRQCIKLVVVLGSASTEISMVYLAEHQTRNPSTWVQSHPKFWLVFKISDLFHKFNWWLRENSFVVFLFTKVGYDHGKTCCSRFFPKLNFDEFTKSSEA